MNAITKIGVRCTLSTKTQESIIMRLTQRKLLLDSGLKKDKLIRVMGENWPHIICTNPLNLVDESKIVFIGLIRKKKTIAWRNGTLYQTTKGKEQGRDKDEGGIYGCLTTKNEDDSWTRVFKVTLLNIYFCWCIKP